MTETAANFPNTEMPTITDLGTEIPKTDGEMIYLEKKNIDEAIHQKLRNKDVYKSDMQKIYNLIPVPRFASAATEARGPRPWRGFTHGP